jgi:hypothetical protein
MATGGVSDIERGTDETFDFLCSVCKEKNKNTEAEKFCSDCNDYYCSACVKFHADIPALKKHKILDTAQLHLGSSVKFLAVPTEMCKLHRHKPVDMYCKNHDVVACSACMLVEHRYVCYTVTFELCCWEIVYVAYALYLMKCFNENMQNTLTKKCFSCKDIY